MESKGGLSGEGLNLFAIVQMVEASLWVRKNIEFSEINRLDNGLV